MVVLLFSSLMAIFCSASKLLLRECSRFVQTSSLGGSFFAGFPCTRAKCLKDLKERSRTPGESSYVSSGMLADNTKWCLDCLRVEFRRLLFCCSEDLEICNLLGTMTSEIKHSSMELAKLCFQLSGPFEYHGI